jgi:hypothetical protein
MAKLRSLSRSSGDVVGIEAVSKPEISERDLIVEDQKLTFKNPFSDLDSILDIFKEQSVLTDTWSSKCLTVTSNCDHQLVILQVEHLTLLLG